MGEEKGVVQFNWSSTPDNLEIIWREERACASNPPGKKGFRMMLIERAIEGPQVDLFVSEHFRVVTITVPMKRRMNGLLGQLVLWNNMTNRRLPEYQVGRG